MQYTERHDGLRTRQDVVQKYTIPVIKSHARNPRPSGVAVRVAVSLLMVASLHCVTPQVSSGTPPFPLSTNQQSRNEAIRAIPMDRLSEPVRQRVANVISRPTIYRQLPMQLTDCDPDLYLFLVRNPDVIVNIWQLMGITKVEVDRLGPYSFQVSDGAGTVSQVELIYGSPDTHVFLAQGTYQGPLFGKQIQGNCVIVATSKFSKQGERTFAHTGLDIFVRLDNVGAEILAKTLHPLIGKTADYNFQETLRFVGQVSQASETNGPGMERLASRLTNLDPAIRGEFTRHTEIVYQRSVLRHGDQLAPLIPNMPAPLSEHPRAAEYSAQATASSASLAPLVPRQRRPLFRR